MYMRAQNHTPQGSQLWELFRLDNKTDSVPVQVVDLAEGQDYVHSLRNLDGDLVFTSVAVPRLFRYHYRKPNYDPAVDKESLEPVYESTTTGIDELKAFTGRTSFTAEADGGRLIVRSSDVIRSVNVCDPSGRTVFSGKANATRITYDTALPAGLYVVTVSTTKGQASRKMVVR